MEQERRQVPTALPKGGHGRALGFSSLGVERLRRAAPFAAHLLPVLWLFGPSLLGERTLYFRDLSLQFVPDYAFLHSALKTGTWPLFNPLVDGGSPCLFAYPLDLLLVATVGPLGPLRFGAPLHVLVAMCGVTALGARLGSGPAGAWLAGAVYGLSGVVLSLVNLLPLLHAAAWAPWILVAFFDLGSTADHRARVRLAMLAALALSTLGADILLQTAIVAAVLVPGVDRVPRRAFLPLLESALLALLLSAPVIAGTIALLQGSARAEGFSVGQALQYSLSFPVLLDVLLPRFFGDVHALSATGYFGQPFFTQGYPYLVSLFVGPLVLILAVLGVRELRTPTLALLSLLLALGENGPFASILAGTPVRFPVKFLWMGTLAIALLAGTGLEKAFSRRSFSSAALAFAAAAILGLAAVSRLAPGRVVGFLTGLLPAVVPGRAVDVVGNQWPAAFLVTGGLAVAAALSLHWPDARPLLAALVVCDLLAGNGVVNTFASPRFYDLRPEVKAAVEQVRYEGPFRWFSYGLGDSETARLSPALRGDFWLFTLDRQALFPRTHALEGLEGIFDVDRTGWAPRGASLAGGERRPSAFRSIHSRLQEENVRFVVSFDELPVDLVSPRATVALSEVLGPLFVYELRDPQPRASFLPLEKVESTPSIRYKRENPHRVLLHVASPPGRIVVRDTWRPELVVEGAGQRLRPARLGRHIAIDTPGGERSFVIQYSPHWPLPAIAMSMLGGLLILVRLAPAWIGHRMTALGARSGR